VVWNEDVERKKTKAGGLDVDHPSGVRLRRPKITFVMLLLVNLLNSQFPSTKYQPGACTTKRSGKSGNKMGKCVLDLSCLVG